MAWAWDLSAWSDQAWADGTWGTLPVTTGGVQALAGMLKRQREAPARRRHRDDKDILDIMSMIAEMLN